MKKKNILLALSGLLFLFAGCSDDDIVEQPSAVAGQEVQFGVSASPMKSTRTAYNGIITEEDKKKYEGLDWVTTDKVRLFCPQSANTMFADYKLNTEIQEPTILEGNPGLIKLGSAGLQWGNSASEHVFYGVYPSPEQFYLEGKMDKAKMLQSNSIFEGYIPKNQHPAFFLSNINTIAEPNMDYAYMGAKTVVSADKLGQPVNMSFVPFVTTLELSFMNKTKSPIKLTSVTVSSADKSPIYGKFRVDLDKIVMSSNGRVQTYPEIEDIDDSKVDRSSVVVSFFEEGGIGSVTIPSEQTLTMTVFLHTTKDLNDLDVTLQSGAGFRKGKITGVTIQHNKKNYIHNIPLNNDFNVSNWITYLPDEAYVRELSIPGAGGVGAGYGFGHGFDDGKSQEQTLTIEQLWDRGIRAFELSVSRNADGENIGLGREIVSCNGKNTGLTLNDAVDKILSKLAANRGEFAMLILTYQPTGIKNKTGRNPGEFMRQLSKYWGNAGVGKLIAKYPAKTGERKITTALYQPSSATVGQSRGKLFCIARPTSAYEDDLLNKETSKVDDSQNSRLIVDNTENHQHVLVINGWGSLKDKWQARGYSFNCEYGPGMGTTDILGNVKPQRPLHSPATTFEKVMPTAADFFYPVQAGKKKVNWNGAWVQEWARVSKGVSGGAYFWANTYDEKCKRIDETFTYAMNHEKGNITYINSLCGYYVDPTIQLSYTPYRGTDHINEGEPGGGGLTGDVVSFARDINLYVYNNLFKKGLNEVTGPLGIILMDRVGTTDDTVVGTSEANTNLPYLIIANNFRFDMKENPSAPASRSAQAEDKYDFIFDASANK